jgi:hypothetical protein
MAVLLETAIQNQGREGPRSESSSVGETARMLVRPKFEVLN